ncbi:Hypothetical protein SRAE_0000053800 [Strongyloides ratti]|uniref:Uncharacterized protein n=1 Tax=Strongyloides ratti TaxID=34506 RepID=A0A090L1P4_STRRB|nr:Hypothetical protein SRAE_0000053800 [Strongyloides ratti]CEF61414.1 Hypothetical protein SRAE_0000053800 [Strongyloides ratti]
MKKIIFYNCNESEDNKENGFSKISYYDDLLDIIKIRLNSMMVIKNVNKVIQNCQKEEIDKSSLKDFKKIIVMLYYDLQIAESIGKRSDKYKIFIYIVEKFSLKKSKELMTSAQLRSRITSRNSCNQKTGKNHN